MKILLADNDHDALDLTTYALERRGHRVVPAQSADQALARWHAERIDLCILAEALPPAGGLEVCRRIRAGSPLPVIVYGDARGEHAIVSALESGADEYLAAPFSLQQLILRIDGLARRMPPQLHDGRAHEGTGRVSVSDLEMSLASFAAQKNGTRLRLTPLEFRILFSLARSSGSVVAVGELTRHRRAQAAGDEGTVLKTHISHIRAKLTTAGGDLLDIRAIPRVGYILSAFTD